MPINYLEKIEEIYAFVSVDEGGEGIIAKQLDLPNGLTFMPFICADKQRMESLKPFAELMSQSTGTKIKLIKFTCREEIEEYSPNDHEEERT